MQYFSRPTPISKVLQGAAIALTALLLPAAAMAQSCGNGAAGFDSWLAQYRTKAAGQGISAATLSSALSGVTYDPTVVRLDRSQRSFKLSFEEFYARRAGPGLIRRGQSMMRTHANTLARVEQRFGVPPSVLVAIWGLETNFGADTSGKFSIIRSIATLAYDCRRSAFFQNELINALRIVQRGDMTPAQMRGGWAGEIGQVQFLPSSYMKYAIDFDGDGRRDLVRSVPDMFASTANFLKGHGWRPKEGWQPGSANYTALQEWNKAQVYSRTIAVAANRMMEGR
jgi:lytic murein transglycosylase